MSIALDMLNWNFSESHAFVIMYNVSMSKIGLSEKYTKPEESLC